MARRPDGAGTRNRCKALTRQGTPCEIPPGEGRDYCHVHQRERRIQFIALLSAITTLFLAVLGLVANVLGIAGFFGLTPSKPQSPEVVQQPQVTIVAAPDATWSETKVFETPAPATSDPALVPEEPERTPWPTPIQAFPGTSAYRVGNDAMLNFSESANPRSLRHILWPDHCFESDSGVRVEPQETITIWWRLDLGDRVPSKITSVVYTHKPELFVWNTIVGDVADIVYFPQQAPPSGAGIFLAKGGTVESHTDHSLEVWDDSDYSSAGLEMVSIIVPITYTSPGASFPIFTVYAENRLGLPYSIYFDSDHTHPTAPQVPCGAGLCYAGVYSAHFTRVVDFNPGRITMPDGSTMQFCD